MREVLRDHMDDILKSDVLERLGLKKRQYILVSAHREENIDILKQGIYHFAADVLVLYSNSKIDMEYFKTLCRTPWSDYEIGNRIDGCIGRLNDRINQYEKMMYRLSMPGVKHIFYG